MSTKEIVSIIKVQNELELYDKVRQGFELIKHQPLRSDEVVAIKPNLCCIKGPETGATTDPRVVEAIIRYLQEEYNISDISIIESDATQLLADMAFKLLGYDALAKKLNVKVVNLSKEKTAKKVFQNNAYLKEIEMPLLMSNVTCLISVPKIKIHTLCCFGATLKNQYGCNPVAKKSKYHSHLEDCMVDLTTAFKPNLIVVDAIVGMEGRGPVCGLPVKMDSLIFGKDVVAVDHLAARLIGINPQQVKYLVDAEKRGLGTSNYEIVGMDFEQAKKPFLHPPKISNKLYGLLSLS